MLPVMLDLARGPVLLYGDGPAALRRLQLLKDAGAGDIRVFAAAAPSPELEEAASDVTVGAPGEAELAAAIALFVVDTPDAAEIAARARQHKVLVNVEDNIPYCDFFMPSMVRRGDLVIAISTGGKSPGLARRLRQKFEGEFGPEWADRLDRLGEARAGWRADGHDMATVAARTNKMIESEGWI